MMDFLTQHTGVVFSGFLCLKYDLVLIFVPPWPTDDVHIAYHDNEWGVPVYDDK